MLTLSGEEIQRELAAIHLRIRDFLKNRSARQAVNDPWVYQNGSGGGLSCVWEGSSHDLLEKG